MSVVLGIDAAWTEGQPSGVALVRSRGSSWECAAVAPGYKAFLELAQRTSVDWRTKPVGGRPDAARLLEASRKILGGGRVDVVAVDMPLSRNSIQGRRKADQEISGHFGTYGCSAHSPSAVRPGKIADEMRGKFEREDFRLSTANTPPGTAPALLEVYPHTALLKLLGRDYRVPYKISKTKKYWPKSQSVEDRRRNILGEWKNILAALQKTIRGIQFSPQGATLASLKRWEDALDALVCAWVGIEYLSGRAKAYGDASAAIWTPPKPSDGVEPE